MEQSSRILQIERLEIKAVVIEFMIFTGAAMALAAGFVSHLSIFLWIPFNVLIAIGFAALGFVLIPLQSLLTRGQGARTLAPSIRIACCVVSAVVYLAISSQMQ